LVEDESALDLKIFLTGKRESDEDGITSAISS
jgi:hypothetical protein